IPLTQQVLISLGLILTLINCGAIMEQKKWVFYLEFLRLLTVASGAVIAYPAGWLSILLLLAALLMIRYFETIREFYLYWVYQRRQ
ncbi:MAG: sterol desaturase family protein, partial [Pseudobacter sp.]